MIFAASCSEFVSDYGLEDELVAMSPATKSQLEARRKRLSLDIGHGADDQDNFLSRRHTDVPGNLLQSHDDLDQQEIGKENGRQRARRDMLRRRSIMEHAVLISPTSVTSGGLSPGSSPNGSPARSPVALAAPSVADADAAYQMRIQTLEASLAQEERRRRRAESDLVAATDVMKRAVEAASALRTERLKLVQIIQQNRRYSMQLPTPTVSLATDYNVVECQSGPYAYYAKSTKLRRVGPHQT
eukprot:SAG31_NODE_70_length_28117_cov_100.521843_29_plen_243_part_00